MSQQFSVYETFNCFMVEHVPSGKVRTMGDGVGIQFPLGEREITVGHPEFVRLWTEALNAEPDVVMEAYFPELEKELEERKQIIKKRIAQSVCVYCGRASHGGDVCVSCDNEHWNAQG